MNSKKFVLQKRVLRHSFFSGIKLAEDGDGDDVPVKPRCRVSDTMPVKHPLF